MEDINHSDYLSFLFTPILYHKTRGLSIPFSKKLLTICERARPGTLAQ
jgi:hypothetical protein